MKSRKPAGSRSNEKTEEAILGFLRSLTIIDAHEHFKPEKDQLAQAVDFSYLLLYTICDLASAGMPSFSPWDRTLSAEEKWRRVKPFWPAVRHGSYAQGTRLNIEFLTGDLDLTEDNYQQLGHVLRKQNQPGIYHRFCSDQLRIERIIVSNGTRATEPFPYSAQDLKLMRLIIGCFSPRSTAELEYYEKATGRPWRTARQMREGIRRLVADAAQDRAVVGFKSMAQPMGAYDIKGTDAALRRMRRQGRLGRDEQSILNRFFYDEAMAAIRPTGLPVAVHCGVWGDYRMVDVGNFIDLVIRNPDIRFDLFHMGMPATRETGLVAKNFSNVTVNLCWSPLLSTSMFEHALQEWMDYVPLNKIIGFGGDIIYCPQLAYGYLEMCRRSLARVMAQRIEGGLMDFDEACRVLRMLMYENPKAIYRL